MSHGTRGQTRSREEAQLSHQLDDPYVDETQTAGPTPETGNIEDNSPGVQPLRENAETLEALSAELATLEQRNQIITLRKRIAEQRALLENPTLDEPSKPLGKSAYAKDLNLPKLDLYHGKTLAECIRWFDQATNHLEVICK